MEPCTLASNRLSRMPEKAAATFESKIARLQVIVGELESGNVELDKTIALFKEGKALADECDGLLKAAQEQIDRAMKGSQTKGQAESASDDIPF